MAERLGYLDIVGDLNASPDLVIDRLCDPTGSYRDAQGRFFCLNPMRGDRSVGSFYINVAPHTRPGKWYDHATGERGDMLDLIMAVERCDRVRAIQVAKQLLGITEMTQATRQEIEARRIKRAQERERAEAKRVKDQSKREGWARALWHASHPIEATPVARYLQGRGIDLDQLPRTPNALRFHPECFRRRMDPETGEIIDDHVPAMIASIIARDGTVIGAHRTYLQVNPDGSVTKATDMDAAKKVLGSKMGGAIRLWSGIGPRGGKGAPLAEAPHGSRVYVAEGIEDGLSVVLLRPEVRVLVTITLENMLHLALPSSVAEVVFCADNDEGVQAKALLEKAIRTHAHAGRRCFIVRNQWGGKDLNDALRQATSEGKGNAA